MSEALQAMSLEHIVSEASRLSRLLASAPPPVEYTEAKHWGDCLDTLLAELRRRDEAVTKLVEAARDTETWWLEEGKNELGRIGAPCCIFSLRAALAAFPEPVNAPH